MGSVTKTTNSRFSFSLLELKPLPPPFSLHPVRDFISQPPLQLEVTVTLGFCQWNVSESGACCFWVACLERNWLLPFSLTTGIDMTMASFNHGERTNSEASRATRWKETGPLTEPVEQSPLPSLDYPPTPGHGRETNPHPVQASALRVTWLQIHYDATNRVCKREGEKVGGETLNLVPPTTPLRSSLSPWLGPNTRMMTSSKTRSCS